MDPADLPNDEASAEGATPARARSAGPSHLWGDLALSGLALDKIRQGLCVFDGDQRLVLFNRRYAEMYDLAPESLRLGMTLRDVIDLRYAAGTGPEMPPQRYATWRDEIAVADTVVETVVELRNGAIHEIHHEPTPGGGWVATFDDITERRRAQAELQASEERYRALVQASAGLVWHARADGSIIGAWGWEEFAGGRLGSFKRRDWLELLHPEDREGALRAVKKAAQDGKLYEAEFRLKRERGYRWVVTRGLPLKSPDGSLREWVGTITDIHDRKTAEAALQTSSERLRLALGAGRMVAWEIDPLTGFVTRSANSYELLGLGSGPLSEYMERVHPDDRERVAAAAKASLGGSKTAVEFRYIHPQGGVIWVEVRALAFHGAGVQRLIGVTFDVTARKAAEERAWRAANHDPLTGLPNRTFFQTRFQETLQKAEQDGTQVALLLVDLDNFKEINDTLGHDAGDALLTHIAECLRSVVKDDDIVARLGGDEFAVVLAAPRTCAEVADTASRVLRALDDSCQHRGQAITSRASIGIAAFPEHDRDPAELMKDADVALYAAKAQGRNRAVVYSPAMRSDMERKIALVRELREALSGGQIVPYYQPRMRLSTGEITGFEALARWRHPTEGLLMPGRFSCAFEEPELAAELGRRMVEQVARDVRQWRDAGLPCGRVAVNISAPEFRDPDLATRILDTLGKAGVPPRCFKVEVTETVFLGNASDQVSQTLQQLHAAGISIALDDFGTGFASLTHLKRFPIDVIKIDQSFVRDLERDPDDAAIVAAVIGLGNSLRLEVVAEGVETLGQAQFLRDSGCDQGQGFLFAKAMPASRVPWFIRHPLVAGTLASAASLAG